MIVNSFTLFAVVSSTTGTQLERLVVTATIQFAHCVYESLKSMCVVCPARASENEIWKLLIR